MVEIIYQAETMHSSPPEQENFPGFFYPGAGRQEVLNQLSAAVGEGIPLLIVTGPAGSGKSTLCRMLEQSLLPEAVPVLFSSTIESFENVVQTVARSLGLDNLASVSAGQIEKTQEAIVSRLLEQQATLVLIFDQAEMIFLATLERIRRMLDRVVVTGARMHLVFAGREAFLKGNEQLAMCCFATSTERRFALSPLSLEETREYLQQCADRSSAIASGGTVKDEVVAKIHRVAQGNLRKINILQEEVNLGNGGNFPCSAPLNLEQEESVARQPSAPNLRGRGRRTPSSSWLYWAGGAVAFSLLFFWLFSDYRHSGKSQLKPGALSAAQKSQPGKVSLEKEIVVFVEPENPVAMAETPAAVPEKSPRDIPDGKEEAEEKTLADFAVIPATPVALPEQPASPGEEQGTAAGPGAVAERKIAADLGMVIVEESFRSPEPDAVVEIVPVSMHKKKPENPVAEQGDAAHLRPRTEEESTTVQPAREEQLYQQRLLAGVPWERGEKDHAYTIQLMVLTSRDAERNILKMLAQAEYRQEVNNLFIFKNASRPENLLVFYGEYPTMAEARQARGALPAFLREYKPYPVAIKGALAKVRK
jgi:type II secretory pathway predicted ATPase ExeA/septal ring-binding cell division protein DamX